MPLHRRIQLFQVIALTFTLLLATHVRAGSETFGDYTVSYTVFNSTFLEPEIAESYGLVRANDRTLINVSVTRTRDGEADTLGLPAEVSGAAVNLIQQRTGLDFEEFSEGDATYYIATLRHTHEETFNFSIQVQPDPEQDPFEIRFSRTLHVEGR